VFYLVMLAIGLVSPVVWLFNAEVVAVWAGLVATRPWPPVVFLLAAGQAVTFSLLFLGGDQLARRFGWLRRRVERFQSDAARLERFRRGSLWWLLAAAIIGIPPLVALSAIAPSLGVRFRTFALVALGGRTVRFFLLAGLPGLFSRWFPVEALPEWLRTI